jgi:hypothetical protein
LVEHELAKFDVIGSNPISRSKLNALVVELEYTLVLEASAERIASSSLAQGTK